MQLGKTKMEQDALLQVKSLLQMPKTHKVQISRGFYTSVV